MPNNLHSLYATPSPKLLHATGRKYGWRRSTKPSSHPRYASPAHHSAGNLPRSVDLSPECPAVYDQGQLGACTGNALAGLFQFLLMKLGKPSFVPSRLMIYWGERQIEGTVDQDAGANGDDGMTFLQTKGVCPETTWPYDVDQFTVEPPAIAWAEAASHKLGSPMTIDNTNIFEIKSCLASGYPIAFGFTVYPELESSQVASTGILPMPGFFEQPIGGHEVLMVGYDDATRHFKIRNSWGPGWGLNGYFLMPYAYATNAKLANDFRSAKFAS
jgi:C1A family cysteine protease